MLYGDRAVLLAHRDKIESIALRLVLMLNGIERVVDLFGPLLDDGLK